MKVKIKRLTKTAKLPQYQKPGDAGMDLYADDVIFSSSFTPKIEVDFGIAVEIPEGYFGLITCRSSIHKTGMMLSNSVGIIDSEYRGPLKAIFYGNSMFQKGDRVAQLLVLPYPTIEWQEVSELSTTERGEGGFGSTGN